MQFALQAALVQVGQQAAGLPTGQQPGSRAGDEQCGDMVSMVPFNINIKICRICRLWVLLNRHSFLHLWAL